MTTDNFDNDWYPFRSNKIEIIRETCRMKPQRILELGAFIGVDSLVLAMLCEELVCIEGREESAEELRRRLDDFELSAETYCVDINHFTLSDLGEFNLVWASGILYHLENPVAIMEQIASVAPVCVGWTHLSPDGISSRDGYYGAWRGEDVGQRLSALEQRSFWLTPAEFVRAWGDCGMACEWLSEVLPHENGGLSGQFIARRF